MKPSDCKYPLPLAGGSHEETLQLSCPWHRRPNTSASAAGQLAQTDSTTPSGLAQPDLTLPAAGSALAAEPVTVTISPWGANLLRWEVPMQTGRRDILLGMDTVSELAQQDKYFGALVGRVANRIGRAQFELDGRVYPLEANNGPNHLHGGHPGFHEQPWRILEQSAQSVRLALTSPAGQAGYPGTLQVQVTYALEADPQRDTGVILWLTYEAQTDAPTLCNLTWHGYFNLAGHQAGTLAGHQLQVFADQFTVLDENSCPTGAIESVANTGLDFRTPQALPTALAKPCPHLKQGRGLDHNFILGFKPYQPLRPAACLQTDDLVLTLETTQPGVQIYTANYLDGILGKRDPQTGIQVAYPAQSGICLEAQAWPDAIHHGHFPSIVLEPGQVYYQKTGYRLHPTP